MNSEEDEATPLLEGSRTSKIQEDDKSVEVKLRDFQLITVPKEAVSYILHMKNITIISVSPCLFPPTYVYMVCNSFIKHA